MFSLRLSPFVPLAGLALAAAIAAPPASAATSGTFSQTGSMNTARVHDTATLLPRGEGLAAGLGSRTDPRPSPDLINPAKRKWTSAATTTNPRATHMPTALPDGRP